MSLLLGFLGETPGLRALDFFIENDLFDYSMADVSREVGMARVTAAKVFGALVEERLLVPTRKVGKAQMYQLNKGSEIVKALMRLDHEIAVQHAGGERQAAVATAR